MRPSFTTHHGHATDAVAPIQSGQRVFVHGAAATPNALLEALVEQHSRLRDVDLVHLHTAGPAKYADVRYRKHFHVSSFFLGSNLRSRFAPGHVDYIPCSLSEIPNLIRSRQVAIDVALLQVSPPDRHGYCTLGTSVDIAKAAADSATTLIAQINPQMPRVQGDGFIHIDRIHHTFEIDQPLPEEAPSPLSDAEVRIGQYAASLIEDGATLQVGIGAIPDAVLGALQHHRHLGVHSEMWTDGVLKLLKCGAIDNSRKKIHAGKTVAGFVTGSREVYEYLHENPAVKLLEIDHVNDPAVIALNPKVVAINSAVEVDLTGQIGADSIGSRIISGSGGQLDFVRGAAGSPGGKAIVALTSRSRRGIPRIVATLQPGAGVVTPRSQAHYIITEYGIADLQGKTLAQRAKALTNIAHPADRESLERAWSQLYA